MDVENQMNHQGGPRQNV